MSLLPSKGKLGSLPKGRLEARPQASPLEQGAGVLG